jgi:hypothetical protein
MQAKALEIRDEGTFIAALAIDMNPAPQYPQKGSFSEQELAASLDANIAQQYLLRRCGYPCDGRPNVILTRLDGNGKATNDPYAWPRTSRTMACAHVFIIEHWDTLKDGDVVDVQHILGETAVCKRPERETIGS